MAKDKNTGFFGHPTPLSTLFATEMWERFSYYGMRALLVLFLTATFATGGFGMSEKEAFTIYGIFTGLVYVTPIIGGILADKVLGQRKSIFIGAIIMALGQFSLATSAMMDGADIENRQMIFYAGLGLLIMGNGFFKPNISTIVGDLYDNNDPRKDGGFTIFYMGINIGALLAPAIAGNLGEKVAWEYGFIISGIGMLIGFFWFYLRRKTLGHLALPPKADPNNNQLVGKDWRDILLYVVIITVATFGFIYGWREIPSVVSTWIIYIAAAAGIIYLAYNIITGTKGKTEWSRVLVVFILAAANIFFWSGYEQAGTSFTIFARDSTDRMIGNYELSASIFQGINPVMIIIFAPMFTVLWSWLDKHRLNPNTPMKFAIGMLLLSTSFVVMAIANGRAEGGTLVSPLWLTLVYLLNTWGELCLSPIGLSMVTKLSPKKIVSTIMGIWMGSFAIGNIVASQMKAIGEALNVPVFWFIAVETFVAALILFALSPFLNRMMKGIK